MKDGAHFASWSFIFWLAGNAKLAATLFHWAQSWGLAIVWLALKCVVWGVAALYLIMTIGIWSTTLRKLGLSSIRYCPRMLRMALRASPIRELLVAFLLPLLAIVVTITQGATIGHIAASPFTAMLLISLLSFTLFLVPPMMLVLSSSTDMQLRWALSLKRFAGSCRIISLLDTGYMTAKPNVSDIWSVMMRRSTSLTDVLRASDADNWQAGVKALIEISPIIIVDTRLCTQALLFEASVVLTSQYKYKAIFVSKDDGHCPLLERLLDEGGVSSDCLASVVKEDELGQLLQELIKSKYTLPQPGCFASAPTRIKKSTGGHPGLERQATGPFETAELQDGHISRASAPEDREALSTALTPFWRLMAKVVVAQNLLLFLASLLTMAGLLRPLFPGSSLITLWSFTFASWGAGALYFYLACSLKKVCIAGDSLFVSDCSKECEIHISQISRVTGPDWTTMRRITIHLHESSAFGKKIVFAGKIFSAGMIARDLQRRVYSHAEAKGKANAVQEQPGARS